MADTINSLPVDDTQPTAPEIQVIEYLFEKDGSQRTARKLAREFQDAFFVAVLFVIFSSSYADICITKFVPKSNNAVILLIVKCIVLMVLYYMYTNHGAAAKKN